MNETGHIVRELERVRSAGTGGAAVDRRVLRTRRALTRALVELAMEKRYRSITVQDLLDRADVGRSTFYAHYRGKDDLLLRSFEAMLDMLDRGMGPAGGVPEDGAEGTERPRVAPARELFAHVGQVLSFHRAMARAHMLDRLFQVGTARLAGTIERRLAALRDSPGSGEVPLPVAARAHAGTLFALLRWWVDEAAPYSPERMDEMFHALVLGGGGSPGTATGVPSRQRSRSSTL